MLKQYSLEFKDEQVNAGYYQMDGSIWISLPSFAAISSEEQNIYGPQHFAIEQADIKLGGMDLYMVFDEHSSGGCQVHWEYERGVFKISIAMTRKDFIRIWKDRPRLEGRLLPLEKAVSIGDLA